MSQKLLRATGRFHVSDHSARIKLDDDFCRYYKKLLQFDSPWIDEEQLPPKYGAHITVVNKKIHKGLLDTSSIKKFNDDVVEFYYDPLVRAGGKVFTTYYVYVECYFAEFIKRKLNIVEPETFLGLHICICNNKAALQRKYPDLLVKGSTSPKAS